MKRLRLLVLAGLGVAVVLAAVVSHYASTSPDGLEKVAADKGIGVHTQEHHLSGSPFADYGTKGVDDARLSGGLAGTTGVVLTFVLGGVLFLALRRRDGLETGDGARGVDSAG